MKVLIADDSPVLVTALRKLLEQSGYEVVAAMDGLEAVQCFYQENPDLVLLDIQMPKLHGYVVCRLLKEDPASRHIPVLILTGRDSAEDRYWGNRSGADGYLTKESMGDELLDAIQSALASRALSDMGRVEPLPQSLDESDVLSRVCEVLDRKLFEATIVNDIVGVGVRAMDLEATVGEALNIIRRILDFEAAAVVLPNERRLLARFEKSVSVGDYDEFRSLSALRCRQFTTADVTVDDLNVAFVNGLASEEMIDASARAGRQRLAIIRGSPAVVSRRGGRRPGARFPTGRGVLRCHRPHPPYHRAPRRQHRRLRPPLSEACLSRRREARSSSLFE